MIFLLDYIYIRIKNITLFSIQVFITTELSSNALTLKDNMGK